MANCLSRISRLEDTFAFERVTLEPISKVLPDIQMMNQQADDLWLGKTKSTLKRLMNQLVAGVHLTSSNEFPTLASFSSPVYDQTWQTQKEQPLDPVCFQKRVALARPPSVFAKTWKGSRESRGILFFGGNNGQRINPHPTARPG